MLVGRAIFPALVIAREKVRTTAAGPGEHFLPVQGKELIVVRRTPRKRIDAIKTENVIDAEKMENLSHAVDALAPPSKILTPHLRPVVNGDAPVLTPFLGELIVFEIRFRRCATGPVEGEPLGVGKDIGAVIADSKWNISHQRDAVLLGELFHSAPLLVCNPLDVAKKIPPLFERDAFIFA